MLEYGDKVFVIIAEKIHSATIRGGVSYKGVVTGYEVSLLPAETLTFKKKNIFVDETDATKALFKQKLKAKETMREIPAEDKKGDRRWIPGYKKRKF